MTWSHLEEELTGIRQHVIQTMAKNMHLFGITPSIGLLYGTMYFHEEPMTLDEMCKELEMSKTSMSTGVRTLSEISMVHKTWKKGVRKDLYRPEMDWYETFVQLFSTKWRKALDTNLKVMKDAEVRLKRMLDQIDQEDDGFKKKIESDLEKIYHAQEYYDWLLRLVETLESGRIFDFVPKRPKDGRIDSTDSKD